MGEGVEGSRGEIGGRREWRGVEGRLEGGGSGGE